MDWENISKKTGCLIIAGILIILAVICLAVGSNGHDSQMMTLSGLLGFFGGLMVFLWIVSYLRELDDRLKQIENK